MFLFDIILELLYTKRGVYQYKGLFNNINKGSYNKKGKRNESKE